VTRLLSYSSLIPPNLFILLALVGVVLAWRWPRAGLVLGTAAVACLYLASTPLVSVLLVRSAEELSSVVPSLPAPAPPGAIIVLSAEYRHNNIPGGKHTVGPLTLERLAQAAREHRASGLPILVSGGWPAHADEPLAAMMAESLENDFHVPVKWREERSRTTYENALYSVEILRRAGVSSALLVTNSWHMARALWSFYAVGYPVVAAPLTADLSLSISPPIVFPQVPALMGSYYALHELIGLAWHVARDSRW
jgi:uncharacterized SAM-binding protein YcdF (DUF218 family)